MTILSRAASRQGAFAVSTLVLGLVAGTAAAQTTYTTGAAEIRQFYATSSTNGYAAAYGGGLLATTNSGASWSRVALPSNIHYVTGVQGNASVTLIAADEGLVRTTDGVTFTQVLYEPVAAVATPSAASSVALAGVKGLGVLRSTDAGQTWTLANDTALTTLDITSLAFDPSNANNAYAAALPDGNGNGGGVFKSTDGGATWAAMPALPAGTCSSNNYVRSVVVDSGGIPYIGVMRPCDNQGDVYSFNGSSWVAGNYLYGVVSVNRDANAGTTIWVGGRILGLDVGSGSSFNYAFSPTTPNPLFESVNAVGSFPGSQNVIMALKGGGMWISTASASPRSWSHLSIASSAASDRVLSAARIGGSSTNWYVGLYAGGVWKTTNSGTSFVPGFQANSSVADFSFAAGYTAVNPLVSIWDLAASPTSANLVYAAAGSIGMFYGNDNPGLFRWDGTQWRGIGSNAPTASPPYNGVAEPGVLALPSQQIFGVALKTGNDSIAYTGLLGGSSGVYNRTTTPSWANSTFSGLTGPQDTRGLVPETTPANVLALPFDDKAALSTDGGLTFNAVTVPQTGFERIRFFAAAQVSGGTWVAGTNKGIFTTSDTTGGTGWTRVSMAGVFKDLPIRAVAYNPSTGHVAAADFDGNRYCSTTSGASWSYLGTLNAGVNAIRYLGGSGLYYLTDGAGLVYDGSC